MGLHFALIATAQAVLQTFNYASVSGAQMASKCVTKSSKDVKAARASWLDNGSIELWAGKLSNRLYVAAFRAPLTLDNPANGGHLRKGV